MPKPGCRNCKRAQAQFRADFYEGYNGDPLEWAESHLRYHDMRRKRNRDAAMKAEGGKP